ncbi:MAG TPA: hypothetical protein VNZ27_04880 [Rhodanobacter sp.]|jgi:hypothetical protein|nr:hypothetical protein [Rhodanobacter sp.]HWX65746.1 hypothetical protein [Rhodanobacter sp.]
MPDMILQHVDNLLVERIKALARDRQWSINDVLLNALRNGLGMSPAQQLSETLREPQTELDGHWEAVEQGVFQEALRALAQTRPTQLAPESIRYGAAASGAE